MKRFLPLLLAVLAWSGCREQSTSRAIESSTSTHRFEAFGLKIGEPIFGKGLNERPVNTLDGETWMEVVYPQPYRDFTNGMIVVENGVLTMIEASYEISTGTSRSMDALLVSEIQGTFLSAALNLETKYGVCTNKSSYWRAWDLPAGSIFLSYQTEASPFSVTIRYTDKERVEKLRKREEETAKERSKRL